MITTPRTVRPERVGRVVNAAIGVSRVTPRGFTPTSPHAAPRDDSSAICLGSESPVASLAARV